MSGFLTVFDCISILQRASSEVVQNELISVPSDLVTLCADLEPRPDLQLTAFIERDARLVGRTTYWQEKFYEENQDTEDEWEQDGLIKRRSYSSCITTLAHWSLMEDNKVQLSKEVLIKAADRLAVSEPYEIQCLDLSTFKAQNELVLSKSQHLFVRELKNEIKAAKSGSFDVTKSFEEFQAPWEHLQSTEPQMEHIEPLNTLRPGFLALSGLDLSIARIQEPIRDGERLFNFDSLERLSEPLELREETLFPDIDDCVITQSEEQREVPRFVSRRDLLEVNRKAHIYTSGDVARQEIARLPFDLYAKEGNILKSGEKQDMVKSIHIFSLRELDLSLPIVSFTSESEEVKEVLKKVGDLKLEAEDWIVIRAQRLIEHVKQIRDSAKVSKLLNWDKLFFEGQDKAIETPRLKEEFIDMIWHSGFVNPNWRKIGLLTPPGAIAQGEKGVADLPEEVPLGSWKSKVSGIGYTVVENDDPIVQNKDGGQSDVSPPLDEEDISVVQETSNFIMETSVVQNDFHYTEQLQLTKGTDQDKIQTTYKFEEVVQTSEMQKHCNLTETLAAGTASPSRFTTDSTMQSSMKESPKGSSTILSEKESSVRLHGGQSQYYSDTPSPIRESSPTYPRDFVTTSEQEDHQQCPTAPTSPLCPSQFVNLQHREDQKQQLHLSSSQFTPSQKRHNEKKEEDGYGSKKIKTD